MNPRSRIVRLERRHPLGRSVVDLSDTELEERIERGRDELVALGYCREDLTLERIAGAEPMPNGSILP